MTSSKTEGVTAVPQSTAASPNGGVDTQPHKESSEFRKQRDVQVQLQYLKDDPIYKTQKPLQITPNFLDKEKRTNIRLAPGPFETINDVRGRESEFSLDANGFRYVHAPTEFKEWSSQPKIAKGYLPELEALLRKNVEGCDEIMFYDARIRHADDAGLRVEGLSYNPFAKQVHTDNTERSVLAKIRNLTEMKADYLLQGRCRIINIWRPIKHAVYDCGLAIADGADLRDGDIMECDRHRQDTGEFWDTMGVIQYRPGFKWYFMFEQHESDVLLFKNYDSSTDVGARTCLHTAFDLPDDCIPTGAPTRESIEVRALIFTHPAHTRRPSGGWSMPQPLVDSLEQNNLKRVDADYSITDRLRTDIDEANEIKDAVLLLRRQQIRRLEGIQDSLQREKDDLKRELALAQQQLDVQTRYIEAMKAQIYDLQQQMKTQHPELRSQIQRLSAELIDARLHQQSVVFSRCSSTGEVGGLMDPEERMIFTQQLERANQEAQKWRAEAMGRGNEAVSEVWQGSVNEAVRRERQKDSIVIDSLRAEIGQLKAGQ